ncbi:MAG TPA: dihydrofolate reductase family protein [Rhizomicrobium sp.]|nr:dihydrofolate reductase family protein [Rhizomicrobium sp.]
MRKIIVSEFISLDGVIEAPGPAHDFKLAGWTMPYWNDTIAQFKSKELSAAGALLLGRTTYDTFAAAWPNRKEDQFADRMNNLPKHVASRTLKNPAWTNSHVIAGDLAAAVKKLKAESGQDILVFGSGKLSAELLKHGLVDELAFLVYPVVLGMGQRFFDGSPHVALMPVETRPMDKGVTLLRYGVQSQA